MLYRPEAFEPLVVRLVTEKTEMQAAPEALVFNAANAERAARFASEVMAFCMDNPKPVAEGWVKMHGRDFRQDLAESSLEGD